MLQNHLAYILQKRASSQPLPGGSAPYTSSSSFKVQSPGAKPKAKSWDHLFNSNAKSLSISPLKAASRAHKHHDMVSLGTARPAPQYFPWESLTFECPESSQPGTEIPLGSGLKMDCVRGEPDYDLGIAMNYGYAAGSPQILRYVTEHVEMIHNPPYDDWESCITCGATSALDIALRIFCEAGDTVLVEKYTYPGTVTCAHSQGLRLQSVELDDQGLDPADLDRQLSSWDPARGPKPFILYTVPTGQNPTGTTQSLERRKEIYRIAEKHDLYIFEDDPYYFIDLGLSAVTPRQDEPLNLDGYLSRLPTSYLSLDVSGRVLRMDSTSKILAPGLRAGWVTGSSAVIEKFISFSEVGVSCPSGATQVMLYKLLDQTWGHEGFIRWLVNLSVQYGRRRDIMVAACKRFLPFDLCIWRVPECGMFIWISIDLSKVQPPDGQDIPWKKYLQVEEAIFSEAQSNGVLVSKGSWFMNNEREMRRVSFRITFAAAAEDSLDRAVERFSITLRSVFKG